jgi:hypothetical protein
VGGGEAEGTDTGNGSGVGVSCAKPRGRDPLGSYPAGGATDHPEGRERDKREAALGEGWDKKVDEISTAGDGSNWVSGERTPWVGIQSGNGPFWRQGRMPREGSEGT